MDRESETERLTEIDAEAETGRRRVMEEKVCN